jgi:hypothetical protein
MNLKTNIHQSTKPVLSAQLEGALVCGRRATSFHSVALCCATGVHLARRVPKPIFFVIQ